MHRIIWQRVNKGATFLSDFNYASFIWNVAEKLRGTYRRADNGKVILPFVVLRRLDCALEANKEKVLEKAKTLKSDTVAKDFELQKVSGYAFYNTSKYDLQKAIGDPTNLKQNLRAYVDGFSPNIREIFEKYDFNTHLTKLDEADLLLAGLLLEERSSSGITSARHCFFGVIGPFQAP